MRKFNVLSVLALLVFSVLLAAPALARPCCYTCSGEPQDDPGCWSVCQPCFLECSGDWDCPSPARCRDGYCTNDPFGGGPLFSLPTADAELSGSQTGVSDFSTLAAELSDSQPGASDSSTSAAELSDSQCFGEDVAEDDLAQER